MKPNSKLEYKSRNDLAQEKFEKDYRTELQKKYPHLVEGKSPRDRLRYLEDGLMGLIAKLQEEGIGVEILGAMQATTYEIRAVRWAIKKDEERQKKDDERRRKVRLKGARELNKSG